MKLILFLILLLVSSGCCSITVIAPVANYHQTMRDCIKVMGIIHGNQIDGVSTAMWCAKSENLHKYEADMKVARLVKEHMEQKPTRRQPK